MVRVGAPIYRGNNIAGQKAQWVPQRVRLRDGIPSMSVVPLSSLHREFSPLVLFPKEESVPFVRLTMRCLHKELRGPKLLLETLTAKCSF